MLQNVHYEYPDGKTRASLSILRRLADLLKKYPDSYRLIGGWAPWFLCDAHSFFGPHVGSMDIDLLLFPEKFPSGKVYETLPRELQHAGFKPEDDNPTSFKWWYYNVYDTVNVRVDFLAPSWKRGEEDRYTNVQGIMAWEAYGTGLASGNCRTISLPDGEAWGLGKLPAQSIPAAGGGAMLVSKAITFHDRRSRVEEQKPYKDAYDITYLITAYREGPEALLGEVRAMLDHDLCREALELLRENFESADSPGPRMAARFSPDVTANPDDILAPLISQQVMAFIERIF